MSSSDLDNIESVFAKVEPSRRKFLERMMISGGAIALVALPISTLWAQGQEPLPEVARHLSIKLCLRWGSLVRLKASLEQGIELMESGMHVPSGRFPTAIFEV